MAIICVLTRQKLRNFLTAHFVALAIWDCLLLLVSFPCFSLAPMLKFSGISTSHYAIVYQYAYPMAQIFRTGSTWILVVLNIERYFGICQPLLNWNRRRPLITVLSVTLAALLFNIPRFFEVELIFDTEKNLTVLEATELRNNRSYHLIYNVILGLSLTTLGPSALMIVLTSLIIRSLRRSAHWRLSVTRSASVTSTYQLKILENTMTIMLVTATVKFLLCTSLTTGIEVCEAITSLSSMELIEWSYLVDLSNVLVVANSSANFLTYLLSGPKFRSEVKRMFRRRISNGYRTESLALSNC